MKDSRLIVRRPSEKKRNLGHVDRQRNKTSLKRRLVLLFAAILLVNSLATAVSYAPCCASESRAVVHPNHFSSAEVRWNEKTGKFEVALNVWPADLEKALAQIAGKSVDLDNQEGLDELIAVYVSKNFRIRKVLSDKVGRQPNPGDAEAIKEKQNESSHLEPGAKNESSESLSDKNATSFAGHQVAGNAESGKSLPGGDLTTAAESTTKTTTAKTHSSHADQHHAQQETVPVPSDAKATPAIEIELPEGFRWVGFESNLKEAWLYFELAGDLEPATWEIENRVFFEFNEEQVNQIRFNSGNQTRSYSLKINQPTWQFLTERSKIREIGGQLRN